MLAVLDFAVSDFQKCISSRDRTERLLFSKAEHWLMEESNWLFSFNNICEVLGLDPQYIRQGLIRWRLQQIEDAKERRSAELSCWSRSSMPYPGINKAEKKETARA